MSPYNGFGPSQGDGWESPEPDEWQEPRTWLGIVMEGEWNIDQAKVQHLIGPEFEMYFQAGVPRG